MLDQLSVKLVFITAMITLLVSCSGSGAQSYSNAYKEAPTQGNSGNSGGTTPNAPSDDYRDIFPIFYGGSVSDGGFIDASNGFIGSSAELNLPVNTDPESSSLMGSITITGLTTAAETVIPLKADTFTDPFTPIVTRIIDDEDNIGSVVYPSANREFVHESVAPGAGFILNIETRFVEDINGDGKGNDLFSVMIPVNFSKGKVTEIDITVSKVPSSKYFSRKGPIFAKSVLELDYSYNGPEGKRTRQLAINYATDLTIFDTNNDRVFDQNDLIGIDSDNDSTFDDIPETPTTEIAPDELGGASGLTVLSGNVIDRWPGRMLIYPESVLSKPLQIIVDPRTALSTSTAQELGLFDIAVGDYIYAQGFIGQGDTFIAISVVVFSPTSADSSGGWDIAFRE